ncbi:MAG: TadE/TadG family type IV pilus assembly protein [Geminicoccaceae bacterium]
MTGERRRRLRIPFARDRRGVVMIEFALLGSFIFLLLLGFIDLGLLFYNNVNLHNATRSVARELRILSNQPAATQAASINTILCNKLILVDCNQVEIDVRSFNDIASITATSTIGTDGHLVNPQLQTVTGEQMLFVTTLYRHRMLTPVGLLLRTPALPGAGGPARLLISRVFTKAEAG